MTGIVILMVALGAYLISAGARGRATNLGGDTKDLFSALLGKGDVAEVLGRKAAPVDPGTVTPGGSVGAATPGAVNKTSTPNTSGLGTRVKATYDALRQAGLSQNAAIGILGNINAESGFNPTIAQPNGDGRGLVQWDKDDRWLSMRAWAKANGYNPDSIQGQVAYVVHEMGTRRLRSGPGTELDAIMKSTSVEDAAWVFMWNFERPGDGSRENAARRAAQGRALFNKYVGGVS